MNQDRLAPSAGRKQTDPATVKPKARVLVVDDTADNLFLMTGLGHMMGKKPLYLTMLRKYAAGQAASVQSIRDALLAQDRATAQRVAHTLKGVSSTIGAVQVAACAGAVEGGIRDGHTDEDLTTAVSELEGPLASLIAGLQAWFMTLPA